MYDDKSGLSLFALDSGIVFTLGKPTTLVEGSILDIADADSTENSNQAGRNVLGLPLNSLIIHQREVPQIVVDRITRAEQLGWSIEAEVAYWVSPRQHEWTGQDAIANRNPTETELIKASNWTERAQDKRGSIRFCSKS